MLKSKREKSYVWCLWPLILAHRNLRQYEFEASIGYSMALSQNKSQSSYHFVLEGESRVLLCSPNILNLPPSFWLHHPNARLQ